MDRRIGLTIRRRRREQAHCSDKAPARHAGHEAGHAAEHLAGAADGAGIAGRHGVDDQGQAQTAVSMGIMVPYSA